MHILSRSRASDDSAAFHSEDPEPSQLPDETQLYPLAVVASELDCGIKELRSRLNGNVVRDENFMRCVPGDVVRRLIAERDAKIAAEREQRRQAASRHAALRAERRRQREQAARSGDPHADALARIGAGWEQ